MAEGLKELLCSTGSATAVLGRLSPLMCCDKFGSMQTSGKRLTMTRNTCLIYLVFLGWAGLAGCSSEAPKKAAAPPDKIQGKAQIVTTETSALDASMNAGGPSVYLVDGLKRYRLFFNKPFQVDPGKEYAAEGVLAQKAIDAIGDPDQGKNGYPLESSCSTVVNRAWPGLALDLGESYANSLRDRVKRYPARAVFLVTNIEPAPADSAKQSKDAGSAEKAAAEVSVPADKQTALLIEGPTVLPAPLWEPSGGTARCKIVIDEDGKIAELNSGAQLCETVPWSQFRYKPTLKAGHPVRVDTEVVVRFDPRK